METTMFVTVMSTDDWQGASNRSKQIERPAFDQIEQAIRSLDGKNRTLVMLGAESGANMGIGGGDGCYIVYATFDNTTFHNVTVPAGDDRIRLVAGGQEGEYPASRCVPLNKALTAARAFATRGELDPSLRWEKE